AVVNGVVWYRDAKVEGERVDDAAAHASRRRAPRHHQCIGSRVDQVACQWRAEEGARVFLWQQDVVLTRGDLGDEVIAVAGNGHDGGHLVGKPPLIEGLLG